MDSSRVPAVGEVVPGTTNCGASRGWYARVQQWGCEGWIWAGPVRPHRGEAECDLAAALARLNDGYGA